MVRHRTPKEQSVVVVLAIVSTNYVVSLKLECNYLDIFVNVHQSKLKGHTETQTTLDIKHRTKTHKAKQHRKLKQWTTRTPLKTFV